MTVLPRSKRNQVTLMLPVARCPLPVWQPVTGNRQLHSEHPELRLLDRCVVRDRESEAEVGARLGGIDHAVVPEARGRIVGAPFSLVLLQDGIGDGALLLGRQLLPLPRELVTLDRGQHAGGLLAAHHADPRVRPHPEEARRIRAAAHAVVSRTERAADDDRELRNGGVGDGVHHLRAVLGDAAALVLLADHESGDVLQKDQWYSSLITDLYKVYCF